MESLKKIDGMMNPESGNDMTKSFTSAAENVNEVIGDTKSSAERIFKDIKDYCRENPGKAMGIAAGMGALVSLILIKSFSQKESANDQIVSGLLRKGEEVWSHLKDGLEPILKNIKESVGE